MTIEEKSYQILLEVALAKLEELWSTDAPEDKIERHCYYIRCIREKDTPLFRKHPDWLSLEILDVTPKKRFYQFTTKGGPVINLFPHGRFGSFLGLQT